MSHDLLKSKSLTKIHYQAGSMLGRIAFEFPGKIFSPMKSTYYCEPNFQFALPENM